MEHIKAEILKHVEHAVIHNFKKKWICNDKNGNVAYARPISSLLVLWLIFLILSRSDVYVELISLLKKNIHFFFWFCLVLFLVCFVLFCVVLFSGFFFFNEGQTLYWWLIIKDSNPTKCIKQFEWASHIFLYAFNN